jgi:FixJ family two-component response regulator
MNTIGWRNLLRGEICGNTAALAKVAQRRENSMPGNVFVIDDDTAIGSAYTRLFSAAGYATTAFSNGEDFLVKYEELPVEDRPDCLVLDLQLQEVSGLEIQERLPEGHAPIVFVSAHGNVGSSVRAMKSGAFDFLEKPADADELLRVVQQAIELHVQESNRRKIVAEVTGCRALLTPREDQVLRYVITGQLNKNIADALGITEKTVKVHRARVFQKMQVRSLAELARRCVIAGIEPATPSLAPPPARNAASVWPEHAATV